MGCKGAATDDAEIPEAARLCVEHAREVFDAQITLLSWIAGLLAIAGFIGLVGGTVTGSEAIYGLFPLGGFAAVFAGLVAHIRGRKQRLPSPFSRRARAKP